MEGKGDAESLRPARPHSSEARKERLLRVLDPGPGRRRGGGRGSRGRGRGGGEAAEREWKEGKGDAKKLTAGAPTVLNPEKKDFCGEG